MDTAEWYNTFAAMEARGQSATYEMLAGRIADDAELLALIEQLPEPKRQPNLLFGAVRFLGGPVGDYQAFRAWTVAEWEAVRRTMRARRTQTNEAGRCAVLLPVLAGLPQPLALIEAGSSAGLCLHPDRYRYHYDDRPVIGADGSPVVLECRTDGPVPVPRGMPSVVWRAGVDLNPLDVRSAEDVRWLESLVWPEQEERFRRLRGAVSVARAAEPARLVRGDLNEVVGGLIAQVPAGATPVVFHSSVLAYVPLEERKALADKVRDCRWISNEPVGVLPFVDGRLPRPAPRDRLVCVLALDGRPLAFTGPHGQFLDWFA